VSCKTSHTSSLDAVSVWWQKKIDMFKMLMATKGLNRPVL